MEDLKVNEKSNFNLFVQSLEKIEDKNKQINYDLKIIKEKEALLQNACRQIKTEFIGIDNQIDQLIMYIRPWFLIPESLRRPVIVSLWGMTGVGKTSLVQSLISKLDKRSLYTGNDMGKYVDSYAERDEGALIQSFINLSGQCGVLLFDEIQIARTISDGGQEIDRIGLRNFWALLDTGKVEVSSSMFKSNIGQIKNILKNLNMQQQGYTYSPSEFEISFLIPYLNISNASQKLLLTALETNPVDVILWILSKLEKNEKETLCLDFTKCLIILSGNIDESFSNIKTVSPVSLTPDELADKVSKITTSNIKEGLFKRFRAEQVARMGTSFVIFKNLKEHDYERIVEKKLTEISKNIEDNFLLKIQFTNNVKKIILKNGLIPSQGVRPIISTIGEVIDVRVPTWILELYKINAKLAVVDFDDFKNSFSLISDDKIIYQDQLVFDKSSENKKVTFSNVQLKYISNHEAAHIVVGVTLFGQLPERIIFEEGYAQNVNPQVRFKEIKVITKEIAESNLAMILSGYAIEEMLFTKSGLSSGAYEDLKMATDLVSHMISEVGMGSHIGQSLKHNDLPHNLSSLKFEDDLLKEKWLNEALVKAKKVLGEQAKLFNAIQNELLLERKLSIAKLETLVQQNFKGSKEDINMIIDRTEHQLFDKIAA